MTQIDPALDDDTLPADDGQPIFDKALEDLPWSPQDALPMDDDGNILPGNDTLDEDLNDNGDMEHNDPEDRVLPPV